MRDVHIRVRGKVERECAGFLGDIFLPIDTARTERMVSHKV